MAFYGSGSGLTGIRKLNNIAVFESNGTWTKPSGVTFIKVFVTGGGGGGGATNTDDTAAGGGAGATAIELIDVSSVSSVSVTVGSGGSGKSVNSNGVVTAGTSSFGSYCSATGGNTGDGNWSIGGGGGTASGGDINISGGDGQGGHIDLTASYVTGGTGGASWYGSGGRGASRQSTGSYRHGQAYGSGGGGASNSNTSRNGKHGVVVVEEYV